jgi:phage gp29-like protein
MAVVTTNRTIKKVLVSEVAKPYQGFEQFLTFLPNPDEVILSEGKDIYDVIMKDAHVFGAVQQRKSFVLSKDWNITPASNDSADTKIAEYVNETIKKELNLYQDLEDLLRAFEHGFAVTEAIWRNDSTGLTLESLLARSWKRFSFKSDGTLLLTGDGPQVTLDMPWKFIVHKNEPEPENPYGTSVLSRCYWPWKFKQAGWEFWLRVLDKFGVPSLAALFEGDMNETATLERAEHIANELLKISSGAAGAFGGVKDIKAIEAKGHSQDFKTFLSVCDSQISKAVLTVTLTTEVSEKGSYSLGQIHEKALKQLTYKDCNALSATLTRTLLKWITELRFGIGTPGPEFKFDFFDAAPWESVRDAMDRGVPVSKRALYSTYNIPEPEGDEDIFIATPQSIQMSDDFFFRQKARQRLKFKK